MGAAEDAERDALVQWKRYEALLGPRRPLGQVLPSGQGLHARTARPLGQSVIQAEKGETLDIGVLERREQQLKPAIEREFFDQLRARKNYIGPLLTLFDGMDFRADWLSAFSSKLDIDKIPDLTQRLESHLRLSGVDGAIKHNGPFEQDKITYTHMARFLLYTQLELFGWTFVGGLLADIKKTVIAMRSSTIDEALLKENLYLAKGCCRVMRQCIDLQEKWSADLFYRATSISLRDIQHTVKNTWASLWGSEWKRMVREIQSQVPTLARALQNKWPNNLSV